ncbi:MAG TPA: efflux RND transporter periplasmic adaptor subunit [Bacteroidia bacterium]|nr:efflux RND transporter periplasmic adaptor subunit [Bacteroidia bacterium]
MTNYLSVILIIVTIISCNKSPAGDKRAELDALKKQQAELKEKIITLEEEIAKSDTSSKDDKSKIVSATEMMPQTFIHFIEVQAKVDGDEDVSLSAEMPGTVTAVLVKPGDKVSKGQVLATLDDRAIHQQLEAMNSQKEMAVTMYSRQKNLWDQKIGSEVQFIQAKTQKEAMEKQYASLQEQWDMTRIKSPINGTVDAVIIKIGSAVAPGFPTIRVVNLTNMKVKAEVAESYISKVKSGCDAVVYFPDLNKEIKTKLSYSGQAINSLNRTFNVEVRLNAKEGEFHPNQVAVLKIADYTAPNVFIVPVGAVQKSTDGEFVYIAGNENGKSVAKRKTVSSGMTYNGLAEIRSGISQGDRVITIGYQNVVDGDLIKL